MRYGKFRKILLLIVIFLLSKESVAFILTPAEEQGLKSAKESCAALDDLGGDNYCIDVGEKLITEGNVIRLTWWLQASSGGCPLKPCIGWISHGEFIDSPPPNTTPTETPTCKGGSIVNVNQGTVGESVMIVGTPFDLVYSSDRVPGNSGNYLLHIPLSAGSTAESVKLSINWLGQVLQESQAATGYYDFVWNGLDSNGQEILNPVKVNLTLTHVYLCGALCVELGYPITTAHWLGSLDNRRFGLGGWSLSSLHYLHGINAGLDVPTILYMGDGRQRTVTPHQITDSTLGEAWFVVDDSEPVIYTFDATGKHLYTRHSLTNSQLYKFNYNANNHLVSIVDSFNNKTTIVRNTLGAITGIRSPYNQLTKITRNTDGWISRITNPNNEAFAMSYQDSKGLLASFTKPGGQIATFAYDANGRLVMDSNSAGNSLSLASTGEGSSYQEITTTTAEGRTSTVISTSYEAFTPPGEKVKFQFNSDSTNEAGFKTTTALIPEQGFSFNYPGFSYSEAYTPDPRFGSALSVIDKINIQGFSVANIAFTRSAVNNSPAPTLFNYDTLTTSADVNGKISQSVFTRASGATVMTSPQNRTNKTVTDKYGRLMSATFATLAPIQFGYDTRGRLTSIKQSTRTSTISYDANGWVSSITNPLGQINAFTTDLAGRVTGMTLPDGRVINFGYDLNGNLNKVIPPTRPAHQLDHNGFDLLSTYTPPLLPTVANEATQYTYNNDRQLTKITRPNGQSAQFNYSPSNSNLASITTPTGTFSYDHDVTRGKIFKTTAPNGLSNNLTWAGNLLTVEEIRNTAEIALGSVSFTYDNDFKVINTTVKDVNSKTSAIAFTYDLDNLLTKAGTMTLTRAAKTGFVTKTTLGQAVDNYTYTAAFGELATHTATVAGLPVFSETLTRDALGRVVSKTENLNGAVTDYTYAYDSAGRLTETTRNGVTYGQYVYDGNSNRIGGTQAGIAINAQYDDQDRLITYGTRTYHYTDNGELQTVTDSVGGATTNFNYDVFGNTQTIQLPNGSNVKYEVDGFNRRVNRIVNGAVNKRYLYQSQLQIAAELAANGALQSQFVYGSKNHVPDYMIRGATKYKFVTDYLGSVRLVVNSATGAIMQQIDYDEFGKVLNDTNPGFQPFGFAGGLYDKDTGLVRFGARDYDARTGRWTSKDPILFAGADLNLYGYTTNDPINWIDPMGLYSYQPHIDNITQNATRNESYTGYCGRYVGNALRGLDPDTAGTGYHINAAQRFLSQFNYYPINPQSLRMSTLEAGDIFVFNPYPVPNKHPNGHIQMWNGNKFVSDTIQSGFLPNRNYQNGSYIQYRLRGPYSPINP